MSKNTLRFATHLCAAMLCVAILFILLTEIILNLTPPISRDALIHHLAIPKLWLENGGFYEMKWATFSYYPMNVDLLYVLPVYFNKDFLANFIHMGFGIGTALLIFFYLSKKMSRLAGLFGIFVFLSTPMVVRLSTEAYVDLGLTFFTTASILAFIRYRDGEYKDFKWLLLSSVAMGLALGTKYNALIAWFFLTTSFIYVYSKDTLEQWKAIKCGLIFFLISLVIFSPWLIKNTILTGNPLFPLMKSFFNAVSGTPIQENTYAIGSGGKYRGIFQMREILYGENFWDTLLIPIRYFFQGQDNNARFFDGVLNPVIIILSPFAFMNKSFYREKLLFICFAVFFILIATFLDQTRIRYILPVVPVLSILTVIGLINIWNWTMNRSNQLRYVRAVLFFSIFIVVMSQNFAYIINYYQKISPLNYVSGKESRDEFISRRDSSYPAMKYINTFTPENAKIRLIFLASRGYYLERIYEDSPDTGMAFIRRLVEASSSDITFRNHLYSLGYTHLLIRTDLFHGFIQNNYSAETDRLITKRLSETTDILYNKGHYAVYKIFDGG